MSLIELIALIDARFRSANSVPVQRAPLKADEWAEIKEALMQKGSDE